MTRKSIIRQGKSSFLQEYTFELNPEFKTTPNLYFASRISKLPHSTPVQFEGKHHQMSDENNLSRFN
ncbi:MAG: hypothetical protein ACFFE8_06250 [Candidatus Heimdallarchaeota archaeon]